MPDHPYWQNCKCEISDDRERAVCERDVDNYAVRNACSYCGTMPAGPEIGNRITLKHGDEKEGDATKNGEPPCQVNNDAVVSVGSESKQKAGDAGFSQYHAGPVGQVGKVPPLRTIVVSERLILAHEWGLTYLKSNSHGVNAQVCVVSTSTVDGSLVGNNTVECK